MNRRQFLTRSAVVGVGLFAPVGFKTANRLWVPKAPNVEEVAIGDLGPCGTLPFQPQLNWDSVEFDLALDAPPIRVGDEIVFVHSPDGQPPWNVRMRVNFMYRTTGKTRLRAHSIDTIYSTSGAVLWEPVPRFLMPSPA